MFLSKLFEIEFFRRKWHVYHFFVFTPCFSEFPNILRYKMQIKTLKSDLSDQSVRPCLIILGPAGLTGILRLRQAF